VTASSRVVETDERREGVSSRAGADGRPPNRSADTERLVRGRRRQRRVCNETRPALEGKAQLLGELSHLSVAITEVLHPSSATRGLISGRAGNSIAIQPHY
jgi:hypothetical protein